MSSFSQVNKTRLKFYGSIRLRSELNEATNKTNQDKGLKNDFLKFRFRLGLRYYKKHWGGGARIRSGNPAFPQNSDTDFGNSFEGTQLFIDKAYIQYASYDFKAWIGKNTLNIWQPDQLLWDVDINPEGIASSQIFNFHRVGIVKIYGGYYIFDSDKTAGKKTGIKNSIFLSQIKYRKFFFYKIRLSIASGWLQTGFEQTDNLPDYQIFFSYLTLQNTGKDLKLILDFFHNFKNDSPFTKPGFENQHTAYAIEAKYRFLHSKITASLKYAYVEKYAIIDRLAQNDWVGNSVKIMDENGHLSYQYDKASNFQGINLSIKYKIQKDIYTQIELWKSQELLSESSGQNLAGYTKIHWQLSYRF